MVTIDNLKDYAKKLMFDMDEDGYARTLEEFETIEKHMALIGQIKDIEKVEPMTFPYVIYHAKLRSDDETEMLDTIDVLKNSKETKFDQVKVPKVVGE
jgi:aspartyl/glutamyl-tRNA(Asn/Gln) amidotransferase C subunit